MHQLELNINGRVQGINFRNSVQKYALGLGLRGWVKNHKDGSVRILAQGQKEVLEEFLNWVQSSPGWASVKDVSFKWKVPEAFHNSFDVVREGGFIADQFNSMKNLARSQK